MKKYRKEISTTEFLQQVIRAKKTDRISIDELKTSLHERGFSILLIIFSLPVFVSVPGMTAIFATPLFFLGLQMMLGFDSPWLPKWVSARSIKRSLFCLMITKSSPLLKKIERFLHPRWLIFSSHLGSKIIGMFVAIFAVSIAIPLPFTNLFPAFAIVIMALGFLSKDGLTIILGLLVGICGVAFTVAVFMFGTKIVFGMINKIINIF